MWYSSWSSAGVGTSNCPSGHARLSSLVQNHDPTIALTVDEWHMFKRSGERCCRTCGYHQGYKLVRWFIHGYIVLANVAFLIEITHLHTARSSCWVTVTKCQCVLSIISVCPCCENMCWFDSSSLHQKWGAQQLSSNPRFDLQMCWECDDKDPCAVLPVADEVLSWSVDTPHENHLHSAPATVIATVVHCLWTACTNYDHGKEFYLAENCWVWWVVGYSRSHQWFCLLTCTCCSWWWPRSGECS